MPSIQVQVRNWDFLPVLLSQKYIAALTGMDVAKVTYLCRNGQIPGARKIGRFWYVEKTRLKEFFERSDPDAKQ